MSIKLMSAAWELPIGSTEKMVLMCLCDHANDDGTCWPSVATISRKTSKSDRTVQAALGWLEKNSYFVRDMRSGVSPIYHLDPRRICTPAESAPPQISHRPPQKTSNTPAESAPKPLREPSRTIKGSSSASDDQPLTPQEIVEDWNSLAASCGLPIVRKLTPARIRTVRTRIRQYPDVEDWRRAFAHIRGSPFLLGENKSGWRADFDFLLQAKSFTKLTEEAYGAA